MSKKKYYDHDPIWQERHVQKNPVWGSYSHIMYSQVLRKADELPLQTKTILDVGCGAGAFGERAREAGYQYTGIDASSKAIELGKKSFNNPKLFVYDFAIENIDISECQDKFALITSINVLHCLTGGIERQNLLLNMRRHAILQGHLILTTMIGPVSIEREDKRIPRSYKSPEEITSELKLVGWRILETSLEAPKVTDMPGNMTVICRADD